jgi:hypothetical protein
MGRRDKASAPSIVVPLRTNKSAIGMLCRGMQRTFLLVVQAPLRLSFCPTDVLPCRLAWKGKCIQVWRTFAIACSLFLLDHRRRGTWQETWDRGSPPPSPCNVRGVSVRERERDGDRETEAKREGRGTRISLLPPSCAEHTESRMVTHSKPFDQIRSRLLCRAQFRSIK